VRGEAAADEQPALLFAGVSAEPAGRAAAQLARELGRDLYRVDLRAVASRNIGETEKNLDRVLETAERTGAVLLFDEGDALFGKRTEARDAHDRYAAFDVNYLLQRLQAFDGVAILACRRKVAELGTAARNFSCVVELAARD
jgi:SpoVK/Ycf46/Vps4 family AAA+-type ATPase